MKIHHLSCGTMCPLGGHLMDGVTPGLGPSQLVCHCLLIENNNELILVDTGFGTEDLVHPHERFDTFFRALDRPKLDLGETAIQQVRRMGFHPEDVRHIILTHLDFDHAGGLSDFPRAQVHIFEAEYETALHKKGFINSRRYHPVQWGHHEKWLRYAVQGDTWFGFESVRQLQGLPPEILLIPLVGHTWGHCGVAIKSRGEWLLMAGDAYFNRGEMSLKRPHCPIGAAAYQTMMQVDRSARLENQVRLRNLLREHGDKIQISCSHDPAELALFQQEEKERELPVPEVRVSYARTREEDLLTDLPL
jgi:glyoxylase-like metal-dependent hydrolase (beta-lactamase superfamily II)